MSGASLHLPRMLPAIPLLMPILAAATTAIPPDEVGFEVLVAAGKPSGFRIDATERVETFDGNPHRVTSAPEVHVAEPGSYAKALAQFARYRALADDPCAATSKDVIAFRLSWRELGTVHAVTFADGCKGIPTDLIDAMRPLAGIVEPRRPAQPGTVELSIKP